MRGEVILEDETLRASGWNAIYGHQCAERVRSLTTPRRGAGMARVNTCRAIGTSQGALLPLPEFLPEPKHPEGWDLGRGEEKMRGGGLEPEKEPGKAIDFSGKNRHKTPSTATNCPPGGQFRKRR